MTKEGTQWQSVAQWPDAVSLGTTNNESHDNHPTEAAALAVVNRLKREGFGGEGKIFPIRAYVIPPTPPTPAGAGTKTPRTDAAVTTHAFGESGRHKYIDPDFARQLERELTSLRRQAEADRATLTRLEEELNGERNMHGQTRVVVEELNTICNDLRNAGQPQFIRSEAIRLLREEVASLRGQLATADKDRERMDWLEKAGNAAFMHTLGTPENPPLGRVVRLGLGSRVKYHEGETYRDCIDAALQPSPSIDHGATGEKR